MNLSVVNHEDYFAKIGDDHKFPINKFGELAKYLIDNWQKEKSCFWQIIPKEMINKFEKPVLLQDIKSA